MNYIKMKAPLNPPMGDFFRMSLCNVSLLPLYFSSDFSIRVLTCIIQHGQKANRVKMNGYAALSAFCPSFLCESKCNSPANVANIMESCFRISDLPEEHIYAIALNTKNQITGIFEVGKGTVNCSLISAREILIRMLLAGAVSFILCHNHPSGDTNPSQEDIQITESIGKAGSLIGVSLLDHLIIGEKNYTSLREIQAVTFE